MHCRACGSVRLKFHRPVYPGRFRDLNPSWFACQECGSLNSSLTYAVTRELYDADYLFHHGQEAERLKEIELGFRGHMNRIMAACPQARDILDVGCLNGPFMKVACEWDRVQPYGFDVIEEAIEAASTRSDTPRDYFRAGSQFEASLFGLRFDVIHCSDVIEHVPEPMLLLHEMRRAAIKHGWLFLQTPAYDVPEEEPMHLWDQESHLCIFSQSELRFLLANAGWRVDDRHTHIFPGGQLYLCEAIGVLRQWNETGGSTVR